MLRSRLSRQSCVSATTSRMAHFAQEGIERAEILQARKKLLMYKATIAAIGSSSDGDTMLNDFEETLAEVRLAAGSALSAGQAAQWLRSQGRPDFANQLRAAARGRNAAAHPAQLSAIRAFAASVNDVAPAPSPWCPADLARQASPRAQPALSRSAVVLPSCETSHRGSAGRRRRRDAS